MPPVQATTHAMKIIRTGVKVRVVSGAGLHSGHEGVVINRRDVPLDGRGIPQLPGEGNYSPMERDEVPIRMNDGHIFTMFTRYLRVVD